MTADPHTDFPAWCREHEACIEGQRFADQHPTLASFWAHCPRSDWMLWVLIRLPSPSRYTKPLRLFAVSCARSVCGTDPRCAATLDCAERYAHGQATDAELEKARVAAASVSAADRASASSSWAMADAATAAKLDARSAQADLLRSIIPYEALL